MHEDSAPGAPSAGLTYGKITQWVLLAGMVIAVAGLAIYLKSGGTIDSACLLHGLWNANDVNTIWKECADHKVSATGHWYVNLLRRGDGVAMLGISVSCMAAVFGVWGACIRLARKKERQRDDMPGLYLGLSLVISLILTLSLLGVISL